MIAYFDSSALVKRLVDEAGSQEAADFAAASDRIATVVVSRVEVAAALAQATRIGRISRAMGLRAQRRFAQDWNELAQVAVSETLLERAESAAWSFGLRGYDALQLAAAQTLRDAMDTPIALVTFDLRLSAAAARAGFAVWPRPTGEV